MNVTLDAIQAILAEAGFEVEPRSEACLWIKHSETDLVVTSILKDRILFNTIVCETMKNEDITEEIKDRLLDSQNGISTSSFQLYKLDNGQTAISLNNFAVLQQLGEDDKDDILSCINFLLVDVFEAHDILSELTGENENDEDDTDEIEVEETEIEVDDENELVESVVESATESDSSYESSDSGDSE